MLCRSIALASAAILLSRHGALALRGAGVRSWRRAGVAALRSTSAGSGDALPSTEEEWKVVLSPNQFAVLRQQATEPPGYSEGTPGELEYELKETAGTKYPSDGAYVCAGCKTPLYYARTKFDSGCGWPAFYDGIPGAIEEIPETDGTPRIEIVCANCKGHLGYVQPPRGVRARRRRQR